jgi:hypothetical protein
MALVPFLVEPVEVQREAKQKLSSAEERSFNYYLLTFIKVNQSSSQTRKAWCDALRSDLFVS